MKDDIASIILQELRDMKADLTPRLRKVESWQDNFSGKMSIIAIVASGVGAWFMNLIKHS